ncbi:MAG: VWA domain-containing protein [Planctomycetes bacterium]|nr:VWA domain-containing protein [Planctomycetota bacterium]
MLPPRLLFPVLLALFAAAVPAQRPKTAAEALARFAAVRDAAEEQRRREVGDLGDFAGPEITAVLLEEVARAQGLGYLPPAVRALGRQARDGAVPALLAVLQQADNNRLMETAAEGLARQGEAGVRALGEVLAAEPGPRRLAACAGLARADGELARDLLLQALQRSGGRDRLPPLRALERSSGDAAVDAVRTALAGDKDPLVAATALRQLADVGHAEAPALALQLLRRLPDDAAGELFAAVLRGLFVAAGACDPEAALGAAARAEDPFGEALVPGWRRAFTVPAFAKWFAETGPLRKPAHERATVAQALAHCAPAGRAAAASTLGRLLQGREPEVVRAAALALAGFGPEPALPPLRQLLASGAEPLQPIALLALHALRAADPAWRAELVQFATSRPAPARAAALQLLAQLVGQDPGPLVAAASANLAHRSWEVRGAAIGLLAAARDAAGVPLLIERLGAETGRLQHDVAEALFALTRLRLPDQPSWRAFWQKEGPAFRVPPAPPAGGRPDQGARATVATYWDLPVHSDRVAFVIDVSGSMNQPFGTGGATRLDEARRQLVRVLGQLGPKARANVIAFATAVSPFAETLQPVDDRRRKAAAAWIEALAARGATNVFAALQRAFVDPEVDTIFLLTDGHPSAGEIVAPEPLARAVAGWNLGRGVRIHTIALGGKSEFLERLARESGGEHVVAK